MVAQAPHSVQAQGPEGITMLEIESRMVERWPRWFEGFNARLARPLLRGFTDFTRLNAIERFLREHPHLTGLEFVEGVMRHLDVRYRVDDLERQRVPERGPCVIFANHPLGALDALALLKMVGDVRRDVRIVANAWLQMVAPIAALLLPVRSNASARMPCRRADRELAATRGKCARGERCGMGGGDCRDCLSGAASVICRSSLSNLRVVLPEEPAATGARLRGEPISLDPANPSRSCPA